MAQKYKVFIDNRLIVFRKKVKKTELTQKTIVDYTDFNPPYLVLSYRSLLSESIDLVVECEDPKFALNSVFSDFEKVYAAGGIVRSKKHFLWIKRWGIWDLPKGKLELKEEVMVGAMREIEEECGVSNLKKGKLIGDTFHVYFWKTKPVIKTTSWFLFESDEKQPIVVQTEEDITEGKWLNIEQANLASKSSYKTIQWVWKQYLKKFG